MLEEMTLEERVEDLETRVFVENDNAPAIMNLRFDRLHVLDDDVRLNSLTIEARELHLEAVKAALGKPGTSFLELTDLEDLPGVSFAAVKELEEAQLFTPVHYQKLGVTAGYTLPLLHVLCGYERPEDMPWHPDYKEEPEEWDN